MWFFSCFRRDPSKDDIKTAKKISLYEEEDRKAREQIEIKRAKEISLELAGQKQDGKRILEESEEGISKQVDVDQDVQQLPHTTSMESFKGKEQINHSKDDVQEYVVNPPPSICIGGKSEISDGGVPGNPQCICCFHCHKPIATHEVIKKGKFHKYCYKEHRHPTCYVCKQKIPLTSEGKREFHVHPFWKEKYCPCHDNDGTAKCCSCERLEESFGTKYVMLADGRWLCRECMEYAVMDTDEGHELHLEIREFFEGLFLKIDKEFPLLLVEKQALNKAEEEEKIDYHRAAVTRGLCMSEEQPVTSIKKKQRIGPNNQLIEMVTETQWVTGCEVTGILILYGFPKLLTGYILAHEMMHAWLRLNGYKNLKLELEEGFCQALGLRWLESRTFASTDAAASVASSSSSPAPPAVTTSKKSDDSSDFEKKFVEFCINQIKEDDSPVYGHGFKQVYQMMVSNNYSLKGTLDEIVRVSKATSDSKF